ncbi:androglobin-like isoform X6 [Haliotis rufescens]|uniref:androglobin-like isoform X6 n=1 Tax=Haliotis rufescens TaxID=6454 RepID=UPI00201E8D34|nr:androglobin-like isoform X6 [Haliotis rufescens]
MASGRTGIMHPVTSSRRPVESKSRRTSFGPRGSIGSLSDIKEGDSVYRTVRCFPSLDCDPEVFYSVGRLRGGGHTHRSSHDRPDSRRGSSWSSHREEFDSPTSEKDRAASIAASAGGADSKRPKFVIWPEWNDSDVNGEKWEAARKDDKKGKSPTAAQHLFDDPDGKIEMPPSLKVDHWKRPHEFIADKILNVVDQEQIVNGFDLISPNEHLHESELMRYIISQISALWEMSAVKAPDPGSMMPGEDDTHTWKPWEHIYALCKAGKGPHLPLYNSHGKYAVRLYWMGCWRKIYVDDSLPFDSEERLLLPATTIQEELWPMLLAKALIKVASLDYTGGSNSCEFGDFSVVHCLNGWLPETIPLQSFMHPKSLSISNCDPCLQPDRPSAAVRASPVVTASQVLEKYFELSMHPSKSAADAQTRPGSKKRDVRYGHMSEVWDLLRVALPEWKLPEQDWEKEATQETIKKDPTTPVEAQKDEKSEKDAITKEIKPEAKEKPGEKGSSKEKPPKDGKDKDKGKEDKKDKKDKDKDKSDKDKDKHKEKSDESVFPENPEVIVFASYCSTPKYPVKVSVLGEMADASERLRQTGLSHLYPHPVLITQTRACPLEPPPPPEKIPAWKLIRPRKKKTTPSDEPIAEPEPPKPIQCVEITSPFVNYKVSPVPIPTDTHRPRSSLERGGTRSRPNTGNVGAIEETDETTQELELSAEEKKDEELLESFIVEDNSKCEEHLDAKSASTKPGSPKKKTSSAKKEGRDTSREQSPKLDRKGSRSSATTGRPERAKSASRSDSRQSKKDGEEEGKKKDKVPTEVKPAPTPAPPAKATTRQDSVSGDTVEESVGLEAGEEQMVEAELTDIGLEDSTPKPKKLWVDFDQFCRCFKTLYIYHKPNTYPCNQKYSDLKRLEAYITAQNVAPQGLQATGGKADKKPAPAAAGVNPSASKTSQTPTHTQNAPSPTNAQGTSSPDDRSPHYLFVDNLEATDIVVSFSALPRWFDPPLPPMDEKKSHTSVKGGKDRDLEKEPTGLTSSSILDGSISPEKPTFPVPVHPGTLVAEPYSWKSLVTGQPILRLRTTASRAAVLSLPAGRHVLRFMMTGPLGYHVHLCSATQFVFGDEETVMSQLTNESCRFRDNAVQVITNLGKCINNLGDTEMFRQAWEDLVQSHCPYRNDKLMSKTHHFQVFNESLYSMLKRALKDVITSNMAFAWRALNFDATSSNIMGLTVGSRPGAPEEVLPNTSMKQAPPEGEPEKVENTWANREPTPDEHVAAVKIQKAHRGAWVRKMKAARTPGTDENLKAIEDLQKSWSILESNAEDNGLYLFREMFKKDPDIMPKYPFYKDEWNKISYADYRGVYPDQPPNTWFIVFREVFYVREEMLAVPKLYVPINTCMLRVVNNDTGEEIPRVFQKVAPYVYKKNRKGYTFVAEARTLDQGMMSGSWRMRLIGSLSPLPSPRNQDVNSSFTAKEIRDYYLPNAKHSIFRYTVKVTEDHLVSLQVNTSKLDVYIKLSVLDHTEEVISAVGKGHIVIPAYIFQKDYNPEEQEAKRSSSRSSNRGGKGGTSILNMAGKGKRGESARSADGRNSRSSQHSEAGVSDLEPEERDTKPHKYIVQATVLKNSWPLTEREWGFVQTLKEQEKNELKVSYKERPPSPPKEKAPAAATQKSKQGKGSKADKGSKEKDKDNKGSRPPSQQFDMTKPFWTFRIVSDASAAEDIETRKDTERADEIRALKKAWEDAEPGRAVKAMQSRLKYLSTHMIRVQPDGGEEAKEERPSTGEGQPAEEAPPTSRETPISFLDQPEGELSLEPPPPPTPKEILQPLDLTPFIKKTTDTPQYLDENEMQQRLEERQKEILEYKQFRERVEKWREEDRQSRNLTKIRQLDQAEELQAALDAARDEVNAPREAFRQKYLEAERKRLEEEAAKEAASKAEQEAKSPKGRQKSAKGKKSPGGKKKK